MPSTSSVWPVDEKAALANLGNASAGSATGRRKESILTTVYLARYIMKGDGSIMILILLQSPPGEAMVRLATIPAGGLYFIANILDDVKGQTVAAPSEEPYI